MSQRELTRLEVIQRVKRKTLKQRQAAELLSLSMRQVKRLCKAYQASGAAGLISKRRGQPSNNRLPEKTINKAQHLLRSRYPDFGPTLATEKLAIEGVPLSVETVRQLLIGEGLWKAKCVRRPVIHQLRERRARCGELVQIDGSPHDWFEGRAPKCTLLVFVDDASSRLMYLQFVEAETTFNYFAGVRSYLSEFGKPLAFYSDKFGVFRVNIPNALSGTGLTQFGRALKELDIELICAHSPQAKGRVERANQTLQDRLTKELRLQPLTSNLSATQQALERVKTIRGAIGYQGSGTILPVGTKPAGGFLSYTSAIWDAIAQSCRNVRKPASVEARRIIVIVTDGNDTSSRLSLEEAIDAAIQSDAIVYALGVGDSSLTDGVNRETLKRLSFETGGRFFAPKRNEDLNEAFKKIATELRSQYLVTYVPQNEDQAGVSYRRIKLALNKGKQTENLRLVYRSGYYFKAH